MSALRYSAIVYTVAFAFLLGCSDVPEPPSDVLPRETFVEVLTDVQIIEAVFNQNLIRNDDPKLRIARYYKETFERHGVEPEAFVRTYNWYYAHPELMMPVYDDVMAQLAQRQGELMQQKAP
jgi:hypothetical protein